LELAAHQRQLLAPRIGDQEREEIKSGLGAHERVLAHGHARADARLARVEHIDDSRYIYVCRYEVVDMDMLGSLRRSRELVVELCDGCARACDAGCRGGAAREQALLRFGGRV
jgi:hypothetical protein